MNYVAKAIMVAIGEIILTSRNVDEACRRIVTIKTEGVAEVLLVKAVLDMIRPIESLEEAYTRTAKVANVDGLLLEPFPVKEQPPEEPKSADVVSSNESLARIKNLLSM